jgi:CRP-like cAMP-binding protein
MRASSRVTIEATLAQHKKARRRRLSRGHSSFSLLLLLHHSPSADESRKEPLTANLDADQIALPQSGMATLTSGRMVSTGPPAGTDRLLILRKGTVAIVKDDTEIAKVAEPGAVFGELSILLDQPHTADVRALEASQFHVANATTLLAQNPIAVLYVATTLAHRLDGANHALIELKNQLLRGEPHGVVARTVTKMEGLLSVGGVTRPGDEFIDD